MKTPFKILTVLSCLLLSAPVWAASVADRIVAVVDDKVITQSDVNEALREAAKARPNKPATSQEVLESLINQKVMEGEMEREKIQVTDKEVEEALKNVAVRNQVSVEELKEKVVKEGLSLNEYKENLREELKRNAYMQKVVYPRVQVGDYDLQEYYKRHLAEFTGFEQIRFFEIFLTPESIGGEDLKSFSLKLYERLKKGLSFAEASKKYSRGAFADKGGDSGLLPTSDLRPDLLGVLDTLPVNTVSRPLPANGGVFIFKVIEKKNPKQLPFNEVKERVRQQYLDGRVQDETERTIMQARSRHFIEIR